MEIKELKKYLELALEDVTKTEDKYSEEVINKAKEALDLFNALVAQVEVLKTVKLSLDYGNKILVEEKELERLVNLEEHYATKATSGRMLKLAVEDLLTYGLYQRDNVTEVLKEINPMIRNILHTKNYVIQKNTKLQAITIGPRSEEKQESGDVFRFDDIDGDDRLIINQRTTKTAFFV